MSSADWTYYYSDALKMRYAIRPRGNGYELMTEDKVRYSWEEISAMDGREIGPAVHAVKSLFCGEIVGILG